MSSGATNLTGPGMAALRRLLFRLAAGETVVTARYAPRGGGFKTAGRRGFIVTRRYAATSWRHDLTPRGRIALAEVSE